MCTKRAAFPSPQGSLYHYMNSPFILLSYNSPESEKGDPRAHGEGLQDLGKYPHYFLNF